MRHSQKVRMKPRQPSIFHKTSQKLKSLTRILRHKNYEYIYIYKPLARAQPSKHTIKRNLTCISHPRHARSPQRVARVKSNTQSHLHFAPSTCTISAEGCAAWTDPIPNLTCISRPGHARSQHPAPAPAPATCLHHVHSQPTAPACTASSQHQHRHPAPAPAPAPATCLHHAHSQLTAPAPAPAPSTSNLSRKRAGNSLLFEVRTP